MVVVDESMKTIIEGRDKGRRHVVVWAFGHEPLQLLWRETVWRHPRLRPRNCCAILVLRSWVWSRYVYMSINQSINN